MDMISKELINKSRLLLIRILEQIDSKYIGNISGFYTVSKSFSGVYFARNIYGW